MSKSLLAILVAIQISTQIVSESVSEIDASKMSIQSRRKVMQENFEEIKLTKQKEELVKIEEENEIKVAIDNEMHGNIHGLTRTLINNMIEGVVNEYKRELEINGVGYRAQKQGKKLVMNLGYSHPVEMEEPEGITFDVPNANTIIVRGIDKETVGQTAAVVRTKRPPEVYRGKGIKYVDEHIRRKEGKTGK